MRGVAMVPVGIDTDVVNEGAVLERCFHLPQRDILSSLQLHQVLLTVYTPTHTRARAHAATDSPSSPPPPPPPPRSLPSPPVSDWECCICDAVVVSEDGTEGDTGTLIEKEQSHSLTPSNVIRQAGRMGLLRLTDTSHCANVSRIAHT